MQRAVESYLSDDDPPAVTSEDQLTDFPSDSDGALALRAYEVLTSFEHPSPFGGSSRNQTSWMIQVDPRFVRRFRGVTTVAGFVARQDDIREEMARESRITPGGLSDGRVLIRTGPPIPYPEDVLSAEAPTVSLVVWRAEPGGREGVRTDLKSRLEGVDVFFSPTSIEPGEDPYDRLYDDGLRGVRALVVVLTKGGAGSAFAIWEAAAAWGQGELVIPVFVDIEPRDVPGPLTIKVQGVHLRERERVDRAIEVLASAFGIANVSTLSDEEYRTLDPVQQGELKVTPVTAAAVAEATVTAVAVGEVKLPAVHTTQDRGLSERPYLVVTRSSYTTAPDGWTRQVEIENIGNGAAVDCGLVCFGDYDSWGFERGFHLRSGAVRATDVRSSQIGPVPDGLFDVGPGVGPRGDRSDAWRSFAATSLACAGGS